MPSLFLSYTREDLPLIQQFEAQLKAHPDLSIWRDQEKIYGGQKWPKVLAEAIADQDVFLLAWSKNAAASHLVEFEWTMALALKQPVILCLLDSTPLPALLASMHTIAISDVAEVVSAISGSSFAHVTGHREEVISLLDQMTAARPEDVLNAARSFLDQRNWTVQGTVIQGEHIAVHVGKSSDSSAKNRLENWRDWIAFAVGIVSLIGGLPLFFESPKQLPSELSPTKAPATRMDTEQPALQTLVGAIRNDANDPIPNVQVSLPKFNRTTMTDSFGQFRFELMASEQETVALLAQRAGYQTYEADVTLGNTALGFTMRKNP